MKRDNSANINAKREYAILLFARHGLIRLDLNEWRRASGKPGQINGLPNSRGILKATNGIDCFIEREDGSVYIGPEHAHWQDDKNTGPRSGQTASGHNKRSDTKRSRVLELYT